MKKKKYRELHNINDKVKQKSQNIKEQPIKKEQSKEVLSTTETPKKDNLEDTKVLFGAKGVLKDIFNNSNKD